MVFSVLQIVAPVFVIIAAGYAALRLGYLEAAALVGLSAFVLRVALPALVFHALAGAPVGETMDARYLAGYCAGSLAIFAVGYLWARRDGRGAGVCAMQGLGMSVSNSGSVGFPIVTLVIGAGAAPILAQTMIVENLVMLPIGLTIAEMAGARGGSLAAVLAGIGLTLIRNPLLIAIAAGIAVAASSLSLPYVAARPVALVGTAAVPLALFVVGGRLAQLGEGGGAPGEVARIVAGQARGASAGGGGGAHTHAGARSGAARGRAPVRGGADDEHLSDLRGALRHGGAECYGAPRCHGLRLRDTDGADPAARARGAGSPRVIAWVTFHNYDVRVRFWVPRAGPCSD